MKEKRRKFLKILTIELEDLKEDIELMQDFYQTREQKGEISSYVFKENLTLLKKEQACIENILESLVDLDLTCCMDLDDLVKKIEDHLLDKIKKSNYPEVVFILFKRRLSKVLQYIEEVV